MKEFTEFAKKTECDGENCGKIFQVKSNFNKEGPDATTLTLRMASPAELQSHAAWLPTDGDRGYLFVFDFNKNIDIENTKLPLSKYADMYQFPLPKRWKGLAGLSLWDFSESGYESDCCQNGITVGMERSGGEMAFAFVHKISLAVKTKLYEKLPMITAEKIVDRGATPLTSTPILITENRIEMIKQKRISPAKLEGILMLSDARLWRCWKEENQRSRQWEHINYGKLVRELPRFYYEGYYGLVKNKLGFREHERTYLKDHLQEMNQCLGNMFYSKKTRDILD
jgi:hypothetical protein